MALTDFNTDLFSVLSASAADSGDTNTNFKSQQRIPKLLKEADWFNQNLVDTTRIVKQGTRFYVPVTKQAFRTMTTEFVEASFIPSVASQLSASFNNKFTLASLPDDVIILGEDGPFCTGSFIQDKVGGIGATTITFTNTSQNANGASWSFSDKEIHQNEFTSSWSALFDRTKVFSLTNNANSESYSGSIIGSTGAVNINGTDAVDGIYYAHNVKGKIFGDGNETTFSASFADVNSTQFIAPREYVVYSGSVNVASGGFLYHPTRPDLVKSVGSETTLYYPASATNVILPYSGSLIQSGTLLYSNAALTQAAANGYYYPSGRRTMVGDYNNTDDLVFGARTSSIAGTLQLVPRIFTSSFTPQI